MARASRVLTVLAVLGCAALVIPMALAEEPAEGTQGVSAAPPIYQLPKVGKPTGRVGGGRRGGFAAFPEVYAIVPDHVGYTTSSQPVLYWYLSEKAHGNVRFELTLIDQESIEPLLDTAFSPPTRAGLQRISLADHGVKLRPGEEYQWSVSLVPDPKDRSKDMVTSGWIEVVPKPAGFEDDLAAAGPDGAAAVYGSAGLWYDTLDATMAQVEKGDEQARSQLSGLLTEIGLPTTAAQ